jgi:hypothetical protein
MNIGFWLGLVFAIPVGIITSIVGNRLTRNVDAFLEKRKLIKSHRSKQQELAEYKRIEAFKHGTKDRYPYYILLATSTVICAVGLATCLVLAVLGYGDFIGLPNPLLLGAFLFGIFAALFIIVVAATARRIEQFEQYQAEIRKKWGKTLFSNRGMISATHLPELPFSAKSSHQIR